MTISRQKRIESEVATGQWSAGSLAYLESRTMHDWYDYVVSRFLIEERAGRLSRAELARRIDKSPAVITRLLSSPSNWTLATLSNLLAGICGEECVPYSRPLIKPVRDRSNDWVWNLQSGQASSAAFDSVVQVKPGGAAAALRGREIRFGQLEAMK